MFDIKEFKREFDAGELYGLEYIENTILRELKYDLVNYTRTDYIKSLFYAVKELNNCMITFENATFENNFKWEYYTELRDLLFKELNIKL